MAVALREAFDGKTVVLTPDLPRHPKEALKLVRKIIDKEQPDLLIGNSCGAFLAQMLAPVVGVPALLGNPHFKMTEFLKERVGEHQYKAPRTDGNQRLVIDEALINEFAELEAVQFDCCSPQGACLGTFWRQRPHCPLFPAFRGALQPHLPLSWRTHAHASGGEDMVCALGRETHEGIS